MSEFLETLKRTAAPADLTPIDVPEWGKVYLRKLTVKDQRDLELDGQDPTVQSLRVLIASMCDEDGRPKLIQDDLDLLLDQPVGILIPLLNEAAKLNGLSGKDVEEAVALFDRSPGADRSTE